MNLSWVAFPWPGRSSGRPLCGRPTYRSAVVGSKGCRYLPLKPLSFAALSRLLCPHMFSHVDRPTRLELIMPILLRTKRATHTIYARLWMFSIAMALWIIPSAVAGPLDNWQWQNPVPSTDQLYGVAFGNNRWIAVGSFGAVVTSNDGTNWQKQMPPTATPSHAFSIAFGNGIFVVPYWTHCFRTTDGTNWSSASFADPPDIFGIERVVFINGEFFGLGQRRHIIASPDGIHWTIRNPPSQQSSFSIRSLSFGNGIYVALSGSTEVMISTDGKAWNAIGLFFPGIVRLAEITFYNDLFYAVSEAGAVYNSPDGVSWTEVAILSCRADRIISNKNGLYVISENCAGKEIIFSADGRTWVERAVGVRTFLRDICIHPSGSLIAVGSTFWDRESILGTAIFSSPDGVEWRRQDRGFHNLLDDVTYGGGKFVAVGGLFTTNATVLVSTNGAEWTRANLASTSRLRRVAYGNGTYVISLKTPAELLPFRSSPQTMRLIGLCKRSPQISALFCSELRMQTENSSVSAPIILSHIPPMGLIGVHKVCTAMTTFGAWPLAMGYSSPSAIKAPSTRPTLITFSPRWTG